MKEVEFSTFEIFQPFEIFLTSILLQNIKNIEGVPFGDIKNFFEKSHSAKREFHCAEKSRNGDPSALEWFCISCWKLWMLSK